MTLASLLALVLLLLAGGVARAEGLEGPTVGLLRISGGSVLINAGADSGVRVGMVCPVVRLGREIAQVRVTRVQPTVCEADFVRGADAAEVTLDDQVLLPTSDTGPGDTAEPEGADASQEQTQPSGGARAPEPTGEPGPVPAREPTGASEGPAPGGSEADLVAALVSEGFENVSVRRTPQGLFVGYEDRLYRWEVAGLERVLEITAPAARPGDLLGITLRDLGVPFLYLEVSAEDYRAFREGRLTPAEFGRRTQLRNQPPEGAGPRANPSYGRADFTLGVGIRGRFLTPRFGKVQGYQHRLRAGVEVALLRGLRFQAREWLPLDDHGFGWHVVPDRLALDYSGWLGSRLLGSVSVGKLQEYISGYRGDLVLFPWSGTTLQLTLGRVERDFSPGKLPRFGVTRGSRITPYMGTLRAKLPSTDAYLVTRYGKFLGGDVGSQVGLEAAFRERVFGFFFTHSSGENQLLLTLTLPLWGRRYSRPSGVRPRLEPDFRYSYASIRPELGRTFESVPLTDSWQALELKDRLKDYVAFLRPGAAPSEVRGESSRAGEAPVLSTPASGGRLQRGTRVVDERALLGPSLYGTTGLLVVPAAEVQPHGYLSYSVNFVDWKHREGALPRSRGTMANEINLGVLPNLEVVVQLTNVEGKLWLQNTDRFGQGVSGWNLDRAVHMQWRLLREAGSRPALAVGWQDISIKGLGPGVTSTPQVGGAKYVVASKHFGELGVHAGWGTDRLQGVFVGFDQRLLPWLRAIADYDTTHTNLGLRALIARRLLWDGYLNGSSGLGMGLTYRLKL